MKQPEFFNPLSYTALSDSLARAIMSSELYPMTTVRDESFDGYGIYALFYDGPFHAITDWRSKTDSAGNLAHLYRRGGAKSPKRDSMEAGRRG